MSLDEIAIKNGTDKATIHPVGAHRYTPHYELWFERLRDRSLNLLEIGVGGGESVRTWLEYFPKAQIFGMDISRDTNPWNSESKAGGRYSFVHCDQTSVTALKEMLSKFFNASVLDIIIDDGSHQSDAVITSFRALWPALAHGGLYCIEDLGVAYGGTMYIPPNWPNHLDWIRTLIDDMNAARGDIASIYLSEQLAIVKKN